MEEKQFTCTDCWKVTCNKQNFPYPEECRTVHMDQDLFQEALAEYEDPVNKKVMEVAAQIEGNYYCKATRVEETLLFAEKMGAKKIGIATCVSTIAEARTFAKILRKKGFEPCGVACKIGNKDKTEIGIQDKNKIHPGCHEAMCNPIMQAKLLNQEKTDLNVMLGLCVGHDALFLKYSQAPTTVLFTKDRVTGNNAVQPLYLMESYYAKLMRD